MYNWLLPEYIADVLPAEARLVEEKRRAVLDLFHAHGYELLSPPLIEYVESLLSSSDTDLDLKTFKLVDQLSGRQMGLRADISPQVARIDAHLINRSGVTRLCYAGSVVHTLPANLLGLREQLQLGAELYGHAGVEADIEVQLLMLEALELLGIRAARLDVGHVGFFRAIIQRYVPEVELASAIFSALQVKDIAALAELSRSLPNEAQSLLQLLPTLYGGPEVIELARQSLPAWPEFDQALSDLEAIRDQLSSTGINLCFDLVELRSGQYHNGLVFAAYADGWANAIARGGRYDNVGRKFGRARPATGFTFDLYEITGRLALGAPQKTILAPYAPADTALQQVIGTLRRAGEIVVVNLPGHEAQIDEMNCDRILRQDKGSWTVVPGAAGNK